MNGKWILEHGVDIRKLGTIDTWTDQSVKRKEYTNVFLRFTLNARNSFQKPIVLK